MNDKTVKPLVEKLKSPVSGQYVDLKDGFGRGYKFEGDEFAHQVFDKIEDAKKRYADQYKARMDAHKEQNRMPALRHSPVIVQVPNNKDFMVLELSDVKRLGLEPYKEVK